MRKLNDQQNKEFEKIKNILNFNSYQNSYFYMKKEIGRKSQFEKSEFNKSRKVSNKITIYSNAEFYLQNINLLNNNNQFSNQGEFNIISLQKNQPKKFFPQ